MAFNEYPYTSWKLLDSKFASEWEPQDTTFYSEADPDIPVERMQVGDIKFPGDVNYRPRGAMFIKTEETLGTFVDNEGATLPIKINRTHRCAEIKMNEVFDFHDIAVIDDGIYPGGWKYHPDNVILHASVGCNFEARRYEAITTGGNTPEDIFYSRTAPFTKVIIDYLEGDGAVKHPDSLESIFSFSSDLFPQDRWTPDPPRGGPFFDPNIYAYHAYVRAHRREGFSTASWISQFEPFVNFQMYVYNKDNITSSPIDNLESLIIQDVRYDLEYDIDDGQTNRQFDYYFLNFKIPHPRMTDLSFIGLENDRFYPFSDAFDDDPAERERASAIRLIYRNDGESYYWAQPKAIGSFYQGDQPTDENLVFRQEVNWPGWELNFDTVTIKPTTDPNFYIKIATDEYFDSRIDERQSLRNQNNKMTGGSKMLDRAATDYGFKLIFRDGGGAVIHTELYSGITPLQAADINNIASAFLSPLNAFPPDYQNPIYAADFFPPAWGDKFRTDYMDNADKGFDYFKKIGESDPSDPGTIAQYDALEAQYGSDYFRIAFVLPERLTAVNRYGVPIDNKTFDMTGMAQSNDGYVGTITAASGPGELTMEEFSVSATRESTNFAPVTENYFVNEYPICFSGFMPAGRFTMATTTDWETATLISHTEAGPVLGFHNTEWDNPITGSQFLPAGQYAESQRAVRKAYQFEPFNLSGRGVTSPDNDKADMELPWIALFLDPSYHDYGTYPIGFKPARFPHALPSPWIDIRNNKPCFAILCSLYPKDIGDNDDIDVEMYENYDKNTNVYSNLIASFENAELVKESRTPFTYIIYIPFICSSYQNELYSFGASDHPFKPVRGYIRIKDNAAIEPKESRNIVQNLDNPLPYYHCTPAWKLIVETGLVSESGFHGADANIYVGSGWAESSPQYVCGGRVNLFRYSNAQLNPQVNVIPFPPTDPPVVTIEDGVVDFGNGDWIVQGNPKGAIERSIANLLVDDFYREEDSEWFCYNVSGSFAGTNTTGDNFSNAVTWTNAKNFRDWKVWNGSSFITPTFRVGKVGSDINGSWTWWVLTPVNFFFINSYADNFDGKWRQSQPGGLGDVSVPFYFFLDPLNEKEAESGGFKTSSLWTGRIDEIPDTRPT